MNKWKRALAGAMSALLVLQCVPYAALADEADPAVSTVQTESADLLDNDAVPEETETPATPVPQSSEVTEQDETPAPEIPEEPVQTEEPEETEEPEVPEQEAAPEENEAAQMPAMLSEQGDAAPLAEVQLQDGTAVIPSDATEDEVREILFDTLVVNKEGLNPQDLDWEYYCQSDWTRLGVSTNWGSVNGFTTEKKDFFGTVTFNYSKLKDNKDGSYQVRLAGTETPVTLTKAAKQSSSITLNENVTVSIPYTEDGTVNYDALRENIFTQLVSSSTPELTVEDVNIEYRATSAGGTKKDWAALEGENKEVIYSYPAISAGEQEIRISYAGNDTYAAAEAKAIVTLTERSEVPYTLKETPDEVTLSVDENLNVDYAAVSEAVFNAVIESSDVLTPDNVTITYYAKATTGAAGNIGYGWPLLEGGKSTQEDLFNLNYPAMSAGTQQVRIYWPGNQQYAPTTIEAQIAVVDRPTATIVTNENPSVKLALTEDLQLDTTKLYSDVFSAVIASSDPELTVDDVAITYYAEATSGSLGIIGHAWMPLEGGTSTGLNYPSLPAGTQTVRISWSGNKDYAPTTVEATVDVQDREQLQFTLNEGSYEVGMAFNDEQGYDYEATAAAIYNAVVASTSPVTLTAADVTVEYNTDKTGIFPVYQPLDYSDPTGLLSFGTGTWEIRISWDGNREYRGNSVVVNVTTTDNRVASSVALKSGVSFTYNMDPSVMKQAVFDNVIDWDNSTLPAKETLTPDNFVIEYKASLTDIESGVDVGLGDLGDLIDTSSLTKWVPIEGETYSIGSTVLGSYPAMGAGDAQPIRISYKGNSEYRPSEQTEGTVTVNKAKVSVSVHSTNIYADEALPSGFITTDPADKFDLYTVYAGVTSNVTTAIYLDLPDRYTDSLFLKILDPVVEELYGKSFTQLMNDGMTLGELRQLLSTQELLNVLGKLNIDTGTFGQILTVINNLPSVTDSLRVSFGTPNRAGLYTVGVVSDNKNYETGVGMGFLLVKMRLSGSHLTWNQEITGKLTAEQAKNFDFTAVLSYDGDPSISQSGVHYLYSGFTSKWRIYSSTTTPPTEPGSYVMTVCILGGNYFALPITRTFTITK